MPKTPATPSHIEQHAHPSPAREGKGDNVPVGGYVLAEGRSRSTSAGRA